MRRLPILSALVAALPAFAAPAAEPAGTVYRLAPEEIARLNAAPPPAFDPLFDRSLYDSVELQRDRRVHGEVGAFVGSGGARGVFGTAAVPLGDTGYATFSFEDSRYDDGRRSRRR